MKVSEAIAKLQSILVHDGDLDFRLIDTMDEMFAVHENVLIDVFSLPNEDGDTMVSVAAIVDQSDVDNADTRPSLRLV